MRCGAVRCWMLQAAAVGVGGLGPFGWWLLVVDVSGQKIVAGDAKTHGLGWVCIYPVYPQCHAIETHTRGCVPTLQCLP